MTTNTKAQTGLTLCCPECGTPGFRILRTQDDGIVDVHNGTERVQRHVPLNIAFGGIKMLCPDPACGYVYEERK